MNTTLLTILLCLFSLCFTWLSLHYRMSATIHCEMLDDPKYGPMQGFIRTKIAIEYLTSCMAAVFGLGLAFCAGRLSV